MSLALATAIAVIAASQAGSLVEFKNPVWNQNFPDPYILQEGETFYAYGTHNGPTGFQLLTSTDLVNWKHEGGVGKPEWSKDQLWAPEVHKWKGEFYLFYSALDPASNKRDLAVAKGPTPKGPFKLVSKLVTGDSVNPKDNQNGAIDPTLYVEDGKPYLLYIREEQPRGLAIAPLSQDLSKIVGEEKVLIWADREVEKGVLDAPTLIKQGKTYWLIYSSGWFQSWKRDACYQVWAASSANLMGPYTKPKEPFLTTKPGETYSPGHQTIFQLNSGEWWMAYHAWDSEGEPMYGHNKLGRTLRIDPLKWTDSGPKVAGPSINLQPAPRVK